MVECDWMWLAAISSVVSLLLVLFIFRMPLVSRDMHLNITCVVLGSVHSWVGGCLQRFGWEATGDLALPTGQ